MIAKSLQVAGHSSRLGEHWRVAAPVFLLGLAIVLVVGFAHPASLHEAAHDTRHALSFPCH
jgi:cobalt transporter subunit CbtB